jgi:DNA mismatch repair protein MutL
MSQQFLFPVQLHFTPQEINILKQVREDLEHTGFLFSNFTKDSIEISGVPVHVPESETSVILEQLINDIENEVPDSHFSPTDLLAKSMAKSLAVKTGQSLTIVEQEHLVNSLFGCKEPNMSPTNKPTFTTLSIDELDKKFI